MRELLNLSIPVYVTREDGNNVRGVWSVNGLFGSMVMVLLMFNALLWTVIALVQGIGILF